MAAAAENIEMSNLVRNLEHQSNEDRIKNLEILLEQVKIVPSSVLLKKDTDRMLLLHRMLMTFLNFEQDYANLTEIIKYVLIRSEFNYRDCFYITANRKLKLKIVQELLEKFDRKARSVTFYLRQILNSEEEKFINLMRVSDQNIARNVAIGVEENFQHILEVTIIAGSLETLKVLLEYGHQYHDLNKLDKPILMTVVDVFEYVKVETRDKYYECLKYLLSQEIVDVGAEKGGLNVMDVVTDPITKMMLWEYRHAEVDK